MATTISKVESVRAKLTSTFPLLPTVHINRYCTYISQLEVAQTKNNSTGKWEPANPWLVKVSDDELVTLFERVAAQKIFIDGETVLLQYIGGKVKPDYTYNAYKNVVIAKYPETIFDWAVVREGDTFCVRKDSGHIYYEHSYGDPFATDRKIIGAYCVIRNSLGEFIEIINRDDITKFRNVARTKTVWDSWADRMVLKSVIKRICRSAFYDLVKHIEEEDNENYELDRVNIEESLQDKIDKCSTVEEVATMYRENVHSVKNVNELVAICTARKQQIESINGNAV